MELFPGTPSPHNQSNKIVRYTGSVTTIRLTNINVIAIHYAFRPRVRNRLTLRRLTLRRNPWIFGVNVSRIHLRYSCQHSHFRYLQHGLPHTFTGLRNAPLPRTIASAPISSANDLIPGTFSAQEDLFRLVSCYAFFKGWLLLSQPPSCHGLPTSFPTTRPDKFKMITTVNRS